MTKVFIGGSRRATRLNAQIQKRIDNIIKGGFSVLVGDANGADKAVQRYLHSKQYQNVEVFCSGRVCRNNVGNWKTRNIDPRIQTRNAQYYSAKDRVMAQEATVGLMMWDGNSIGTLLNLFRLLNQKKKAVVYTVPEKKFVEFRSSTEWEDFLMGRDSQLRSKIQARTKQETTIETQEFQWSLLE